MITAALEKFARNAPAFAVIALLSDREHEPAGGREIVGWFHDQTRAELATLNVRESVGCTSAMTVHRDDYLPALADCIVFFDRVIRGDQFDHGAALKMIEAAHGIWPRELALAILAPLVEEVMQRQQPPARRKRRALPQSALSANMEIAPCLH